MTLLGVQPNCLRIGMCVSFRVRFRVRVWVRVRFRVRVRVRVRVRGGIRVRVRGRGRVTVRVRVSVVRAFGNGVGRLGASWTANCPSPCLRRGWGSGLGERQR